MVLYIHCSILLTPKRTLKDAAILIENGKIVAVGPDSEVACPSGAQTMDAHGLTAAPGYIDWQLNGAFGHDYTENPETIWKSAARLPEYGVTACLPTIITSPFEKYAAAIETLKKGAPKDFRGAWPLGLHFEGPFLNPGKKGAHNPVYLRLPSLTETQAWSRQNGVWLVTLAPELPGAHNLIRALRARDVVVSAGHSLATYEEAQAAFEAGITCATHLFNAMPPLDHRSPGLIAALLNAPQVSVGLIPDGIHVHPQMVALAWRLKGQRRLAIVTDAISALGMPPGKYQLADFPINVDETSVRLDNGTLAGSILRMDAAVRNLMAFTGCSLAEAVSSATANVARLIGTRRKGSLRSGVDGDVVLLSPEAQVMATIVRGQVVYSRMD